MLGLQIAKAAGAITIITSSSDEKLKYVKDKFGADYVINYKTTPNWAAEANKITNGRGVDFILENGGSGTIKQSIEAITAGGIITIIGFLSPASQADMPDVATLALQNSCIIRGIFVGPKQFLDELVTFVAKKQVEIPIEKTFGFSTQEVHSAYEYLKQGGHIGKVCINVS
jgi:NADPH:quinone reductase-like Zn-dependent oxidoreductase